MRGDHPPLVLIAAVACNGVIGSGNVTPWHIPGDLAHFRASTMGKPMILGRKTFESIGGALPGRPAVVLSRDRAFSPADVEVARILEDAVSMSRRIGRDMDASAVMVAGGASVYAAAMPQADELLISAVDLSPSGDALFPAIDPALWMETESHPGEPGPGDGASFKIKRFRRRLS